MGCRTSRTSLEVLTSSFRERNSSVKAESMETMMLMVKTQQILKPHSSQLLRKRVSIDFDCLRLICNADVLIPTVFYLYCVIVISNLIEISPGVPQLQWNIRMYQHTYVSLFTIRFNSFNYVVISPYPWEIHVHLFSRVTIYTLIFYC